MSPSITQPSSLPSHDLVHPPIDDCVDPMQPLPALTSSITGVLPPANQFPIVICKVMHSARNLHPICNFLSFHWLLLPFYAFASTLSFVLVPNTIREGLLILGGNTQ